MATGVDIRIVRSELHEYTIDQRLGDLATLEQAIDLATAHRENAANTIPSGGEVSEVKLRWDEEHITVFFEMRLRRE